MNFKLMNAVMTIVVVSVLLFGCDGNEFMTSADGYEYKYIKKGTGALPKSGEIVVYNMKYIDEKDSLIFETDADQPAYVAFDSMQWSNMGPLYKAFKIIKEGDSILIKVPTKTLFEESLRAAVPPGLNPEGSITCCIGASAIMTEEEMEMEAMAKRERQMDADIEAIDQYLEENDISAQSTDSGLRYVIDVEGTGNYPQPGDNVTVNYRGSLLDGTQFDSSFDRDEPITFTLGIGRVIMGWDEGIALMKAGGKGTLYIPSPMAYGEPGRGGIIPPNTVLKFDVELIKIN